MTAAELAAYLTAYAGSFDAPIEERQRRPRAAAAPTTASPCDTADASLVSAATS